jgi:hypothetical protein
MSGTFLTAAIGVNSRVLSSCSTATAVRVKLPIVAGMTVSSTVSVLMDVRSVREDVGEAGSLLAADTSDRVSKSGVKMPSSDRGVSGASGALVETDISSMSLIPFIAATRDPNSGSCFSRSNSSWCKLPACSSDVVGPWVITEYDGVQGDLGRSSRVVVSGMARDELVGSSSPNVAT